MSALFIPSMLITSGMKHDIRGRKRMRIHMARSRNMYRLMTGVMYRWSYPGCSAKWVSIKE